MLIENRAKKLLFHGIIHFLLFSFAVMCIVPFITLITISISDEGDIVKNGYSLFPREISMLAYEHIFRRPYQLLNSYYVSIAVTVVGTVASTVIMSLAAYPLSRQDFRWNKIITFYVFFTMLFNGGLVPTYIVMVKVLHLRNSFFALIVPLLVGAWNVFLLRTFMKSIPMEVIESAKMDGASELFIYYKIIVPMSKPALASIGLLVALGFWNSWFPALLYIDNNKFVPLQFWMMRVLQNINFLLSPQASDSVGLVDISDLPTESIKMAMALLATGPMMFVFPFFQKYFTKGIRVGAIKG